jgi:uncharacterized MAPEG superfamily protein
MSTGQTEGMIASMIARNGVLMKLWILAVLALFFIQTMLAPTAQWLLGRGANVKDALGARDNPPPMPVSGARLDRALRNMIEAMFLFLPLALLAEIKGITDGLAVQGAAVFLIARIAYVPAYVSAIPGLRSLIWVVGHVGLGMIATALI